MPQILFLVQVDCLEEIGLVDSVLLASRQEVSNVLHLFERYFHGVEFHTTDYCIGESTTICICDGLIQLQFKVINGRANFRLRNMGISNWKRNTSEDVFLDQRVNSGADNAHITFIRKTIHS